MKYLVFSSEGVDIFDSESHQLEAKLEKPCNRQNWRWCFAYGQGKIAYIDRTRGVDESRLQVLSMKGEIIASIDSIPINFTTHGPAKPKAFSGRHLMISTAYGPVVVDWLIDEKVHDVFDSPFSQRTLAKTYRSDGKFRIYSSLFPKPIVMKSNESNKLSEVQFPNMLSYQSVQVSGNGDYLVLLSDTTYSEFQVIDIVKL